MSPQDSVYLPDAAFSDNAHPDPSELVTISALSDTLNTGPSRECLSELDLPLFQLMIDGFVPFNIEAKRTYCGARQARFIPQLPSSLDLAT
ncbi:uncharacterized protein ARMOST_17927 [Armillaria ostoyae]|uniref:Uncharacterized protein n=1 Tax=Armillaria ostoyae TaxID=47428 RepID=A0A284S0D5_ARMOS|nr:uncharacterized protein ARMOST_17927 [Armillaria ostoyae]